MGLGRALLSCPVVRQLRGPDVFARGTAVTSRRTEQLIARTGGYLPMPKVGEHDDIDGYMDAISSPDQKGSWTEARAYLVSLLKSYWGDAAIEANDYCFHYLPRLTGDHGTYHTVMDMMEDKVEGYFLIGQNPAVGSADGKMQRLAMAHLKWLVVRDLNVIDSATFWKDSPKSRPVSWSPRISGPRCSSCRRHRTLRRTALSSRRSDFCNGITRR